MLYTLQDISLACCSAMCCTGGIFLWMILAVARRAGKGIGGIPEVIAGISGGGLLSLFSLNGVTQLILEFLRGQGGDDFGGRRG